MTGWRCKWLALFVLSSCSREQTQTDACAHAVPVDVIDHDVELRIGLAPPALRGHGEIKLRARQDTTAVLLDTVALNVTEARDRQVTLRHQQRADQLCVALAQPLTAAGERTLSLTWEALPESKPRHFAPDQLWIGYRAAAWLPTVQDPAQRATLALRLIVPAGMKVAASGRLQAIEHRRDGELHAFQLDRPTPPFLYAFAVGQFTEASHRGQDYRLRALGPADGQLDAALARTVPMVEFLRERTGAALPLELYTQVFVHGDAAQEAAGMALIGEDALHAEPSDDWIFSHELAHQWFGWLVPCTDFADFWLNEGFATFFVAAYKEQRWGRDAYEQEVARWRERSQKVQQDGNDAPVALSRPGMPARRGPLDSELQARGVTYSRGALVLHKLRETLGEEIFWRGIRGYVAARAGKGARTGDLRAAFEAAGASDLQPFFARWVYAAASDF